MIWNKKKQKEGYLITYLKLRVKPKGMNLLIDFGFTEFHSCLAQYDCSVNPRQNPRQLSLFVIERNNPLPHTSSPLPVIHA